MIQTNIQKNIVFIYSLFFMFSHCYFQEFAICILNSTLTRLVDTMKQELAVVSSATVLLFVEVFKKPLVVLSTAGKWCSHKDADSDTRVLIYCGQGRFFRTQVGK